MKPRTLADSLDEFYNRTDEKSIARDLLEAKFSNIRFDRALDVGAGTGELSRVLSSRSSELVLLENDPAHAEKLANDFPSATILIQSVVNTELQGTFDVILFSHVLYYMPETTWLDLVQKLFSKLRPGGQLVIIMNSDTCHWGQLMQEFYDELSSAKGMYYAPWRGFRDSLIELDPNLEVTAYKYGTFFNSHEETAKFIGETAFWIQDRKTLDEYYPRFLEFSQAIPAGKNGKYVFTVEAEIVVLKNRAIQ